MNTDLSCSSVFNFNATHNGIQCIQSLKPEDQGTERQIWFSAKMLANFFECSGDTIRRRIEVLVVSGDLNEAQNCFSLNVPNAQGNGSVKTTLYNLTVLNKIAMTFIDCQRAVEIRKAFNDVVIKHETNSINDIIQKAITDPDFAIGILTNLKQEKQLRLQAEAERDEAIRTKACIGSKREATLMVAKREDNKKIKALTCENTELKEQNEDLQKEKDKLFKSFGCTPKKYDWLTVSVMRDIWQRNFKKDPQWQDLKRIIKENNLIEPIKDVKEIVNNKEKFVNRYPRRAWELYYNEELERKNQTEE